MAKETSIGIKLIADLRNYQTNMSKAQSATKQFGGVMKNTMSDAKSAITAFASGDFSALPKFFMSATQGAGAFSKGLQGVKAALISTGIGAIIVGLGVAVAALTQYFKGSEEGQIKFKQVMNSVKAYTEPVLALFGKLGKALVALFSGNFKEAWETAKSAVTGVGDAIKKNTSNLKELNDLEAKLVKDRRKAGTEEKRLEAEIAELKLKAYDETAGSAQQRLKWIDETTKKEKELAGIRLNLADEELRIAQLKADQGDNTIDVNDKLVELEDAKLQIQRQQDENMRAVLKKRNTLVKQAAAELEIEKQIAQSRSDKFTTTATARITTQVAVTTGGDDPTKHLQNMGDSIDANKERLKSFNDEWQAFQNQPSNLEILSGQFGALGNAIGGAGGSFLNFVSQMLQLIPLLISQISALTVSQVASSQAVATAKGSEAIASGTAASQSVPFPFNLIALAVTIASIVAALAKMPKFATGGIVPGASFTGDKVLARVNSGEEILTASDPRHRNNLGGGTSPGGSNNVQILNEAKLKGEDIYILMKKVERRVSRRT